MSSPLDTDYNYMGVLFCCGTWKSICRSCIYPPDAAFHWGGDEGADAGMMLILWHEDEREDERPTRWHLSTLFAALEQLYARRESAQEALVRLVMVKHRDNPRRVLPPINLRLWRTGLCLCSPFCLEQFDSFEAMERRFCADALGEEEYGSYAAWSRRLRRPLPRCAEAVYKAAEEEWRRLVVARVGFLLDAIGDARSYILLKPMLDEWAFYYYHLGGYDMKIVQRIDGLRSQPWYAEVQQLMPGLRLPS